MCSFTDVAGFSVEFSLVVGMIRNYRASHTELSSGSVLFFPVRKIASLYRDQRSDRNMPRCTRARSTGTVYLHEVPHSLTRERYPVYVYPRAYMCVRVKSSRGFYLTIAFFRRL